MFEYQRARVGLFGVACIEILPRLSSSSIENAYYIEVMEIKNHLDIKGDGHGGGGSVVPTISAGGVTKIYPCASMSGDRIDGEACNTVV